MSSMDANKLCMGCMANLENAEASCPACGYNPQDSAKSPHQLTPNTILSGKYLVGRVLGEGGFGITYLGYDLNLDIKIAVKEYFPSGLVTRETIATRTSTVIPFAGEKREHYAAGLEKFVHEAKSLAKFYTLPGIVAVKDFFRENGTAYIVMEFVDGITLKSHLVQQGGKLSADKVLGLMQPLMDSLTQIHKAGIIHRDISPDNIMIVQGGVKLIDFGAARDFASDSNQSRTVLLKPGYAPEEQYRTHGEQGPWTDVYALSATLYKCITGETPPEALERARQDDLIPPSKLGSLSPIQEAALLKGLAVYRENRYQSIEELCQALYKKDSKPNVAIEQTAVISGAISNEQTPVFPIQRIEPNPKSWSKKQSKRFWCKYKKTVFSTIAVLSALIVFAVLIDNAGAKREAVNRPNASDSAKTPIPTKTPVPSISLTPTPRPASTIEPEASFAPSRIEPSRQELARFNRYTMACGNEHTLVLKPDSQIIGVGNNEHNQCATDGWTDIIQMAGGFAHSIGLRRDGTVAATLLPKGDKNEYGQCNVAGWTNIVQIDCGWVHSVGLKADGTVVATGFNEHGQCNVKQWSDIAEVAAGAWNTAARTRDGRVLAIGDNQYGQNNTPWETITQVAAGRQFIVGLRADGTVMAAGRNKEKQCEVTSWTDMIAIAAGDYHTVGLRADGTVVSTAMPSGDKNNYGQGNVSSWTDICAVFAGARGTVGMKKDGSLVYAGIDIHALNTVVMQTSAVFAPDTQEPINQVKQ